MRERSRGVIDTSLLTENPLPDKFRVKVRTTPSKSPPSPRHRASFRGSRTSMYAPDHRAAPAQLRRVLGASGIA